MAKKSTKLVYSAGGIDFVIYKSTKPAKSRDRSYWLLIDHSTGKRRTLNHVSLKAAKNRADGIRAAMVKGQASRLTLSEAQWQEVCMALEVFKSAEINTTMGNAIREWATCRTILGNRISLEKLCFNYMNQLESGRPQMQPTRFMDAAKRFHQFKVAGGLADGHCANIESRLIKQLPKVLPNEAHLHDLTTGQLEDAVLKLNLQPKTRNDYRTMLGDLYKWAAKQNPPLVTHGYNPAQAMTIYNRVQSEIVFVTHVELEKILVALNQHRPDLVPLIVLVAFGALRPSEAARVDWSEVGEDYIRLPGPKSKTRRNRQIAIQPNLKAWLALWRKPSGSVCSPISLAHVNAAIYRWSGIIVKHDAVRHGFGSHRFRSTGNIHSVSDEMGNSVKIARDHYVNAFVTEEDAKAWFAITPDKLLKPATALVEGSTADHHPATLNK